MQLFSASTNEYEIISIEYDIHEVQLGSLPIERFVPSLPMKVPAPQQVMIIWRNRSEIFICSALGELSRLLADLLGKPVTTPTFRASLASEVTLHIRLLI